jgi:hypothetical protein
MEAVCSSETSIPYVGLHGITEDHNLINHNSENLKSHKFVTTKTLSVEFEVLTAVATTSSTFGI